jgi:Zn finger protein HypA/HybF involved in hydrogenase expression
MSAETPASLQGHIYQHRKQLQNYAASIDTKKKQIEALKQEINKCTLRHQIRRKYDLQEQVSKLQSQIEHLQTGEVLHEFDEKVKPFLQEQERCKDIFRMEDRLGKKSDLVVPSKKRTHSHLQGSSASTNTSAGGNSLMSFMRKKARTDQLLNTDDTNAKSRVIDDYMMIVQDKAPPINMQAEDMCETCKEPMLLEMEQSILACPKCGLSKRYMDATSNAMAYGEEVEFAAYSYQRTNYFNEYLTMFQAKESSQVEIKDIMAVMEVLWEERIMDKNKITLEKIREIVRKKRMHHVYKQITQIWCKIRGTKPPRLTSQQEEQCRLMFKAIQEPFERHCPPERKNFFSYSYCLYKFMELLGYSQFLKHFPLLKDRPKLRAMDAIWKKICEDLDWEYRESPME